MSNKIDIAVVGLGKMGLSHFSMVNAHPLTRTVACDGSRFVADVLGRNTPTQIYRDYDKMLADTKLDAVVIATPSKLHAPMVRAALDRGVHVFCEKPFCLNWQEATELAETAEAAGQVNQVGYHYRYVGAFREMHRILQSGALGRVTHVLAEAYGPVVLRSKRQTWRTQKSEGGGCLYDYAAHPLNLLNWFFGTPTRVSGSVMSTVFSENIDDQVMSTLEWEGGPVGQLSVNWSDESHRKMTTRISMVGTNGRMFANRQECQLYLRTPVATLPDYGPGWTVKYTTELTDESWFYLRGEEYSAQLDDFIYAAAAGRPEAVRNDFRSAAETDRTMAMVVANAETGSAQGQAPTAPSPARPGRRGWFRRG